MTHTESHQLALWSKPMESTARQAPIWPVQSTGATSAPNGSTGRLAGIDRLPPAARATAHELARRMGDDLIGFSPVACQRPDSRSLQGIDSATARRPF